MIDARKKLPSNWRLFAEARTYAHNLGLKNRDSWIEWAKSKDKPDDIPAKPSRVYKDQGWVGWGDWLGTGRIANQCRSYRRFEEARTYVQSLGFKCRGDWHTWSKSNDRPTDIPSNPDKFYKDEGWQGWGDWLGTGTIAVFNRKYRSFEDARAYVHSLNLKSQTQWRVWSKTLDKPDDIPANPIQVYEDQGWINWGNWLGTGTIAPFNRIYLPFEEARAFARSLGLKNQTEWKDWTKNGAKPDNIPANPRQTYKNKGW